MRVLKKNYREMSDEELDAWREKIIESEFVGDQKEEHTKELHAMQSPVRREIMTLLKDKALKVEELADKLNLDLKMVNYHLQFLKDTYYVTIEEDIVDLTPLGVAYTRHVLK